MIVLWRITERCNLSCSFCAYDQHLFRSRREAKVSQMRRFASVLAEYQRVKHDNVLVSWIGGEPFLFRPLNDLTLLLTQELGLHVSATTNGTLLGSKKLRQHILAHYRELTVSVDGVGMVHDILRGWRGGYESLRESVIQLSEAKRIDRRGPKLRANVVLMRDTVHDFEQLCFELASWGIEEITFNQLGGRDRPEFFPTHRLLPEDTIWLTQTIPSLRAKLSALGVNLAGGDNYLFRIHTSALDKKIPIASCNPGEQFLFINEDGLVSPCSFTTEGYGISLDDVDCAEAVCELPMRFARLQSEKRLSPCHDCQSTHIFAKFAA
jgi:MoaA/NifB/PqqE/SkfB family radical SAM enzyme